MNSSLFLMLLAVSIYWETDKMCATRMIWLLFSLIHVTFEQSRTNFEIRRFEICEPTPGEIVFTGNITKEKGQHYFHFDLRTPIPWDDSLSVACRIESRVIGKNFVELFTIREKNACKAANTYMGEFWYDIERAAQYSPGVCPIPAGRYHAHHVPLDFTKIALQTFPFGRLRFITKLINNRNAVMLCILAEFENVVN